MHFLHASMSFLFLNFGHCCATLEDDQHLILKRFILSSFLSFNDLSESDWWLTSCKNMSFLFDFVSFSNHTLPNVALAFGWIPSLVNQFITLQGISFYNTWCTDYFCVLNTVSTNHLFCIQQKTHKSLITAPLFLVDFSCILNITAINKLFVVIFLSAFSRKSGKCDTLNVGWKNNGL